jgi:hypothetical protein
MGTLEDLLDDGWRYHDGESERLAGELEAVTEAPPERLAAFVHLAVHTIGEHLGDWPRAYALGRRILRGHEADEETAPAWERLYVAAALSADGIGAADLELTALHVASDPLASLLAMRLHLVEALVSADRAAEAGRIYRLALDVASRTSPTPSLDRTVASVSNNLAWALHDLPARSPDEDGMMARAADASLAAWRRSGSWINEELALYLGARVAHARGDSASALDLAGTGLQVIAANDPRPFDSARFHLLRAAVLTALNDPVGRADALSNADAAGRHIGFEHLRVQYAAERAQLDRPA